MKHRIYILMILTLGFGLSVNAQEKPKPKNCDQYLTESTGSAVRPDDGWCNYDGAYAKCQCENDQRFKRWREEFDRNNRLAKEDKQRLIQLEKSIIDRTKVIRDLNLNEDHENFVENKNKAIQIYEQAISQLSSLQVNYVNDENTDLKQNRVTLEKTKRQQIEYWRNEIALLKSKHPTKKAEFSFGGETGNGESTDDETKEDEESEEEKTKEDTYIPQYTLRESYDIAIDAEKRLRAQGKVGTSEYQQNMQQIEYLEKRLGMDGNNSYSTNAKAQTIADAITSLPIREPDESKNYWELSYTSVPSINILDFGPTLRSFWSNFFIQIDIKGSFGSYDAYFIKDQSDNRSDVKNNSTKGNIYVPVSGLNSERISTSEDIYRIYERTTKFYYGINVGFGIGLNFPINHNSAIGIAAIGTGRAFTPIVESEFNHKYGISYEMGRLRFAMYYQFLSIDANRVNVVIPPSDHDYISEKNPGLILAHFVNTDYFDETTIFNGNSNSSVEVYEPKRSSEISNEKVSEFNKINKGYIQFAVGISF